jgi:hypothetical protein
LTFWLWTKKQKYFRILNNITEDFTSDIIRAFFGGVGGITFAIVVSRTKQRSLATLMSGESGCPFDN